MRRILLGATLLSLAPFAALGVQRTFRKATIHRVEGEGTDPPAASDPGFPDWVERFTGARFRGGNEVEILCDGDETFPRLWSDLEGAERFIHFQTYFAESGRAAGVTFGLLQRKARAGVKVRFLYDPVGCRGLAEGDLDALRRAGVEAHPLRPFGIGNLDRANHRVHSRVVLVDGSVGYTGDFGISDRWLGDGRSRGSWRSTNARFVGPALREHAAAFAILWAETTGVMLASEGISADPAPGAEMRAALLHSIPGVGSTAAQRLWALTAEGARRSCYIASGYFAPTVGQEQSLVEAARRGVDVRILNAAPEHTDVPAAYWAGRSRYAALLDAGVRLYEYRPSMMHAKFWVVDGVWSSIGALNLDNRSVSLNDEVALMIHDRGLAGRLTGDFMVDLTYARRILPEDLERSGWRERAAAWVAARINPLL